MTAPSVKFRITDDWGDGFNGEITITAGSTRLDDWSLSFLAPFTIENMWTSGSLTGIANGWTTVGGADWNQDIAAGKSTSFGFTAARGNTPLDMPTAFLLNGQPVSAPALSVSDLRVDEVAKKAVFTITLSEAMAKSVSFDWKTVDGTAMAGQDYVAAAGRLTFAAGQTSRTVTVKLLPDSIHEGRETFSLDITNANNASIADGHGIATIVDDDPAPNNGAQGYISTSGNQFVDEAGHAVRIGAVNWYGMETTRFAPDGLDQRNWMEMMDQMAELGFNAIRLPFSSQALAGADLPTQINYRVNPDLYGLKPVEIMDKIIDYAGQIGLRVLLDRHRGAAGDGPNENGLWYDTQYSEQKWIDDWVMLANRYAGDPTVLGADLANEPHAATWGDGAATDWKAAAERAGNAILAANPHWLIVVEGTGTYQGEGYWWGGNLLGARDAPVQLSLPGRLVYSAHDYPHSIFPQSFFDDPDFPNNMPALFERMWGHLFTSGTAPVLLGEFGSAMTDARDLAWLQALTAYLNGDFNADGVRDLPAGQLGISWAYWAWNTNGGSSTGILDTDWRTPVSSKLVALETLMGLRFPEEGQALPAGRLALTLGNTTLGQEAEALHWTDANGPHAATLPETPVLTLLDGSISFRGDSDAAMVENLYRALLGRDGDTAGRSHWVAEMAQGGALASVAGAMAGSAEGQAAAQGQDAEAFLHHLYASVLFRGADAGGLAAWQGALAGGMGRAEVAAAFAGSAEAQLDPGGKAAAGLVAVEPGAAWIGFGFEALLGRHAGAAEFALLLAGAGQDGPDAALGRLMQGAEFQAGLGARADAGFVGGLYEGVLHRTADAGGLAYFTAALAAGATRQEVALEVLHSAEAQGLYQGYMAHGVEVW